MSQSILGKRLKLTAKNEALCGVDVQIRNLFVIIR